MFLIMLQTIKVSSCYIRISVGLFIRKNDWRGRSNYHLNFCLVSNRSFL